MLAKPTQDIRLYEFGPFLLDTAERLLVTNGTAVSLAPRAFDLLVVLVEKNGSLVTKDDLLKLVWQDVCVEEGNVSYSVSLVRKALGDNAASPRYVATVSKLGYRFIAPVKRSIEPINSPPAIHTETESNGSYGQDPTLTPTSDRLPSPPLKNHLWHLLAVSVLYALYYSVAFMLEVAYQYETHGTRALKITPLIFIWVIGTSLVALGGGLRRTSRGSTSGILFSVSIFIGAGLMLYLVLGLLFLPNHAITLASFQTYPAKGAFLKSIYYVLPLVVLFVVLPFHLIVASERELLNRKFRPGLYLHRDSRSAASVGSLTCWLAGILLGAFCCALLGTARLFENLQSSANTGLFIQLAQWRFLLYFLIGLECVLWYQQAQHQTNGKLWGERHAWVA
jgi:DNA-binding winged helix-turn-helix (wHTH) protein